MRSVLAFVFVSSSLLLALPASAQLDERWGCEADLQMTGTDDGDHLGFEVASGGDWNGDGLDDVLVGGGIENAAGVSDVLLYLGQDCPTNPCNVPHEPVRFALAFRDLLVHADDYTWGTRFAFVGDVDDGGLDDIAIGEPFWTNGSGVEQVGRVFVFFGESFVGTPLLTDVDPELDADLIVEGTDEYGWFGYSLDGIEVTPGDAYGDLLVGAPANVLGDLSTLPGSVYTLQGQAIAAASGSVAWTALSPTTFVGLGSQDRFGFDLATIGDLGSDGVEEFVVGAPQLEVEDFVDPTPTCAGCTGYAQVFSPPSTTALRTYSEMAPMNGELAGFGVSVAATSSVNANGFAEAIVGAPYYAAPDPDETGPVQTGAVYVYEGRNGALLYGGPIAPEDPAAPGEPDGAFAGSLFGWSVAGTDDYEGDGTGDFAIGAPRFVEPAGSSPCGTIRGVPGDLLGRVVVIDGSDGDTELARYRGEVGGAKPRMGWAIASGDVDGDGAPDTIAGHVGFSLIQPPIEEGRVFVFFNAPCCP